MRFLKDSQLFSVEGVLSNFSARSSASPAESYGTLTNSLNITFYKDPEFCGNAFWIRSINRVIVVMDSGDHSFYNMSKAIVRRHSLLHIPQAVKEERGRHNSGDRLKHAGSMNGPFTASLSEGKPPKAPGKFKKFRRKLSFSAFRERKRTMSSDSEQDWVSERDLTQENGVVSSRLSRQYNMDEVFDSSKDINGLFADKVCHHSNCQDGNDHNPLLLCDDCDQVIHADSPESGHLRFDLFPGRNNSMPVKHISGGVGSKSDDDYDEEDEDDENGNDDDDDDGDAEADSSVQNTRLKRKKALKGRRHHTEDSSPLPLTIRSKSLQHFDFSESADKSDMNKTSGLSKSFDTSSPRDTGFNTATSFSKENKKHPEVKVSCSGLNVPNDCVFHDPSDSESDIGSSISRKKSNTSCHSDSVAMGSSAMETQGPRKLYQSAYREQRPVRPDNSGRQRKRSVPVQLMKTVSDEVYKQSSLGMEYFTLRFDLTTEKDIEIVAAVKGVNLRNAILQACEKRGLNIDSLCVYLASSKTPLPLEADTFPLGGNNLNVRVKDGEQAYIHRSGSTISLAQGKRPVEKKQAGSQRSKKNFPGLDEPPVNDANAYGTLRNMERSRPPKPQSKLSTLFNPFTKGQEKQEQLGSLLNEYSTRGWPEMPELLTLGTKHYSDSQFQLEEHWTGFVDDKESLSKSQKDHQEALWELLYTEVDYIKKVKVIIDLFMACLYNLQNESIFNEIKTEMVFSNVLDVYQANCSLWVDYMLPVIEKARSIKHPINASLLKEGFAKFERILQPYTKYCLEYESCKEYIRKSREKNELFDKFLMWAESHEQCSRLKLEDLIVFPWQRLTKYHLLLKAIRKPVDISENEKLCNDLDDMTEKVEQFGIQVNRVMRQRLENERLSSIIDRIEAYDAIDAPNEECLKMISEFTKVESFLRGQLPGCGSQEYRQLIREGPIKLKDTYSRMDVYVFLFTDMLLITKSIRKGDKVKVIKPPMRLDKVVVHILRDGGSFLLLHLNEYSTASAVYTLHGDSAKSWLEVIKKAQAEYAKKRNQAMSRTESSVLDFTINENEESDFSSSYHPHTYQTGNGDRSPDSLTRQNSTGSVESFIPSMGLPRSSSCGGEIDSDCREGNASRPRAATYSTDPRSRTPQFLFPRHSSSDNNLESRAAGKSPPNSPINFRQQRDMECQTHISYSDSLPEVKMDTHPGEATIAQPSNIDKLLLTQQPDLVYDENLRRLNQRRSSRGEKRYHTADAIQDMQKDKDASIHKRLSWNFGATVDISIEERASGLRGMPFNSDSLRSIPSSSGVSSQGSLHLTPESDICEEIESEVVPSTSNNDHPKQRTDPEPHIDNKTNSSTYSSEQSQTDNPNLANSNSSSLSKSSPDICDLYSKLNINSAEVQDGIGSVEISAGTKNQNKKMSQSQLLRVKKKLLLSNSTVEASEV